MVAILVRSESEDDPGVKYELHPDETMIRITNDYARRIGYPAQEFSITRAGHKGFPKIKVTVKELNIKHGEVFSVKGHVRTNYFFITLTCIYFYAKSMLILDISHYYRSRE